MSDFRLIGRFGLRLATAMAVMLSSRCTVAADPLAAANGDAVEFFEKHVRPVLAQHCLACHGDKEKGGLRLDSRSAMLAGGDSGPAISPGDPAASRLIQAVEYQGEPKMPPEGKLPVASLAALAQWVQMGAPWPVQAEQARDPASKITSTPHWAFQPVRMPPRPAPAHRDWVRSEVDYFVLARLEQHQLAPSATADRRALIRRATFDVTGLPPTVEDVEAFVSDTSPDAFDRVIERLLSSPHYGERWARHWLDVARYADTKGYLFTQDRNYPNAYRYRDWVVRALNADMPYDDFLVAQIAGDLLPPPRKDESLAAMGFLTVGRRFLGNPHDIIDDRLDVLTRGTMALTVTCARCHDHKYDPIPTRDYYSLYGVLASSVEPSEPADLMTLADAPQPVVPHVLLRGNPGNPGEAVPRQFLSVLAGEERQPFGAGSGRLELARVIANPDNPLTARVIVNRVWQYYFDKPLVATPSDFGLRSEPPSHPELLDFLAANLMANHWSLKALHRLILGSATYQQASLDRAECRQVDAENRLLWRMNRKRLDFEALRDALLVAGAQLDPTIGGPAVELGKTPVCRRRTLYGLIDRQNLPNLFRTFDFASPDTHSPRRFATTVPQQALYLMNNPFVIEMARSASQLVSIERAEASQCVEQLHLRLLARRPTTDETELALAFLAGEGTRASAAASANDSGGSAAVPAPLEAWQRYVQVMLLSNEFIYLD